jgi:PQQ-dependent catabolism-associated beta-propeller protein
MRTPVMAFLAGTATALSVQLAVAETIYVSNELDNTISVIDAETLAVVATVPVGRRPRGLALGRDGRSLYVAAGDDNRIDLVDLATRETTGHLPSGEDPEVFAVHPDGKRLFVANENDNLVSVLDISRRRLIGEVEVGVEPEGMAVSPDGKFVLCTSETTSMVHIIDAATLALVDNILVDTRPRWAAMSPDNQQIWVSSEIRGTVTVIDAATHLEIGKIGFEVPGVDRQLVQAVGFAINRAGTRAYVALGPSNRVAEVDARTFRVERLYLVGQRVWHLALSADEKRLYTANGNSSDVTVIDLEKQEPVASIGVGRGPWGVAVGP